MTSESLCISPHCCVYHYKLLPIHNNILITCVTSSPDGLPKTTDPSLSIAFHLRLLGIFAGPASTHEAPCKTAPNDTGYHFRYRKAFGTLLEFVRLVVILIHHQGCIHDQLCGDPQVLIMYGSNAQKRLQRRCHYGVCWSLRIAVALSWNMSWSCWSVCICWNRGAMAGSNRSHIYGGYCKVCGSWIIPGLPSANIS